MMLTKETMVHIAVVTAVTGAVFGIILSSGAVNLNELEIQVFAKAELANDILFLQYVIHNTGDFEIQKVTVTAACCSHVKELYNTDNSIPLLNVLDSKDYLDVIPVTGFITGDEIILQFDAYGMMGNHDVDILTVILN